MASDQMRLPHDSVTIGITIATVMAITVLIAFLLISLARQNIAF